MLRLEDEIAIQESKLIQKWNSNKIPLALKPLLVEKIDDLRGKRFVTSRNSPTYIECTESRLRRRSAGSIANIV